MAVSLSKAARAGAMVCILAAAGIAWGQETAPTDATQKGPSTTGPAKAEGDAKETPVKPMSDKPSVTTAKLTSVDGKTIEYTATTGYMPLKDEKGKLRANMFYVAYTVGGKPGVTTQPVDAPSTRPVTFVFNGGPGAASVWLHLGAVGPRRLDVPEDGTAPQAPFKVVDNEYSWLPATDLVFVDPVNTGYSRADNPDQAKEFFGVKEDIAGMGEFVRLYLTKYERWNCPVLLAGESYGTTRASGLANYLQERVGVSVSGVILISTVLNFSALSPGENNDLPYALYLPSYAAVAWYHHKLDSGRPIELAPLLKQAEDFATNQYSAALMKGTAISNEERDATAKRLSELTGLSVPYIIESHLRIPPFRFEKELLRSSDGVGSLVIGRFDGRITGAPTDPINDSQEYDPSLSGFFPAYTSAFNDYVRRTLKYDNDVTYEVLSNRVQPWNWESGTVDGGYVYIGDKLRDALTHNPHMKLLVCSGHFDLATPFFATDYQLNHMTLAPEIRKNITQTYYDGGHMLYHVRPALAKLHDDVTAFISSASSVSTAPK